MSKLWFKRKTYGWGWVPVSWEGWMILVVYIAFMWSITRKITAQTYAENYSIGGFMLSVLIATVLLIVVCYLKGEKPKWMWGKKKDGTEK